MPCYIAAFAVGLSNPSPRRAIYRPIWFLDLLRNWGQSIINLSPLRCATGWQGCQKYALFNLYRLRGVQNGAKCAKCIDLYRRFSWSQKSFPNCIALKQTLHLVTNTFSEALFGCFTLPDKTCVKSGLTVCRIWWWYSV